MTLAHKHSLMVVGFVIACALALAVLMLGNAAAQCAPWDLNCMNLP